MSIWNYYTVHIGELTELFILFMYLAYSYTLLLRESVQREFALKDLRQTVEKKVILRTHKLNDKNQTLEIEIANKTILLKELYHRVKNNLQMISSLLSIQSMSIQDPASKELLTEMTHRIQSISFIHEKLYQSKDLRHLSMQEYLSLIIIELQKGLDYEEVTFDISCKDIYLDLEMSMPIGLIINELIINSFKYAFEKTSQNKHICIGMYRSYDTLILEVSDNGRGAIISDINDGFGYQLVESMVIYQLKGKIEMINDKGMHYKMIFT